MRYSKWDMRQFIAWDGEGEEGEDGVQRYTLLCNSLGDYIYDKDGISTEAALEFICNTAKLHKYAIHVIFGGSYDVNMILRDIGTTSKQLIEHIWNNRNTNEYTHIGPYELHYVPRKEFSIREYKWNSSTGRREWDENRHRYCLEANCTIWDVWGFFQSSFVDAITKWLGDDYIDLPIIKRGKERRGSFNNNECKDTLNYCQAELKALVLIMNKLHSDLEECGLKISRWDGAGAIACALMKKYNIKEHKSESPKEVYEASKSAYAGGRIEAVQYGYYDDRVYHYDINSAYPEAIARLPSLARGEWRKGTSTERNEFSLSYVRWSFDGCRVYPFFHRDYQNSISFPSTGEGWHWQPEVRAAEYAIATGAITGTLEVVETWNFHPTVNIKPFSFVLQLYDIRQSWKRDGISAEKVLKLGMNSLYGKMAQQVGFKSDGPPTYFQLEWAGYVTAFTRAKLYLAAIQNSKSVIMIATDGIYLTAPINLERGSGLGQWEYKEHSGVFVVQSGVYWTFNNGDDKQFSRGFDKGTLDYEAIRTTMRKGEPIYKASQTRFIGMGVAVKQESMWSHWCTWYTSEKDLRLGPHGTKRIDFTHPTMVRRIKPWKQLVPTLPRYNYCPDLPSKPYSIKWDSDELDEEYQMNIEASREAVAV